MRQVQDGRCGPGAERTGQLTDAEGERIARILLFLFNRHQVVPAWELLHPREPSVLISGKLPYRHPISSSSCPAVSFPLPFPVIQAPAHPDTFFTCFPLLFSVPSPIIYFLAKTLAGALVARVSAGCRVCENSNTSRGSVTYPVTALAAAV